MAIRWPSGKRLLVLVNVVLEGWSEQGAPGIGPMGNPLRPGVRDTQAVSWAEYGPRCGMPRLLRILDEAQVRATVLTSGVIAERYPQLVREISQAGHELCGHSMAQDIVPAYLTEAEERENIRRSLEVLADAAGERPVGWCSPRGTPSSRTAELLAEYGFQWTGDVFDADLPYWLATDKGRLAAIPFTMEVNDMPLYVRYGNAPQTYLQVLRRIVEGWYEANPEEMGCLDVTVHAHVFGRPYGAVEYRDALRFLRSKPWIWCATHREVVQAMQ